MHTTEAALQATERTTRMVFAPIHPTTRAAAEATSRSIDPAMSPVIPSREAPGNQRSARRSRRQQSAIGSAIAKEQTAIGSAIAKQNHRRSTLAGEEGAHPPLSGLPLGLFRRYLEHAALGTDVVTRARLC